MPEEAMAVLTEVLDERNKLARRIAVAALSQLDPVIGNSVPPFVGQLMSPCVETRKAAAALLDCVLRAKWTEPTKLARRDYRDPHLERSEIIEAAVEDALLGHRIEDLVQVLIARLEDEDGATRAQAACVLGCLGYLGSQAEAAIPALFQAIQDQQERVRVPAKEALDRIDPTARDRLERAQEEARCKAEEEAVPALLKALWDRDLSVRRRAARELGRLRRAGIPALFGALRSPEKAVRRRAAWAFRQFGPEASAAQDLFRKALEDEHGGVRRVAAGALGRIGPPALPAVPALRAALKDANLEVRGAAAWALGRIQGEIYQK
jgi:HEAT repeat protein